MPCDLFESFFVPEKFCEESLFLDGLLFVDESRSVDGSLFVTGSRLVNESLCDTEPFWLALDERVFGFDDALEIASSASPMMLAVRVDVDVELFILFFYDFYDGRAHAIACSKKLCYRC